MKLPIQVITAALACTFLCAIAPHAIAQDVTAPTAAPAAPEAITANSPAPAATATTQESAPQMMHNEMTHGKQHAMHHAGKKQCSHCNHKRGMQIKAVAELGMLAVFSHRAQLGENGTDISYIRDGGQENLYFNQRYSLELSPRQRHHVVLLYQPFALETDQKIKREFMADEVTFPAGTPMRFGYDSPFYRASYLYDVVDSKKHRLALGGSLQIRNYSMTFQSLDGALLKTKRDISAQPLLKAYWEYRPKASWWLASEIDALYAPVSYLNGTGDDGTSALLDLSMRVGMPMNEFADVFFNLRYLAGGVEGTNDDSPPADGFVKNWAHFGVASIGFTLDPARTGKPKSECSGNTAQCKHHKHDNH